MEVETLEYPTEEDWFAVKQRKNSSEYMMGRRFGQVVIIKQVKDKYFPNGRHRDQWLCKCDCGTTWVTLGDSLRYGQTKSCGCRIKQGLHRSHNQSNTRLYRCWQDMKARCYNPKNKRFARYGKRGIKICDEWLKFESFYKWAISNGYAQDLTIDRIDFNKDYSPKNCRWVTLKEQMNNMSRNVKITFNNKTLTYSEWEVVTGIKQHTIAKRIKQGWTIENALTIPVRTYKTKETM